MTPRLNDALNAAAGAMAGLNANLKEHPHVAIGRNVEAWARQRELDRLAEAAPDLLEALELIVGSQYTFIKNAAVEAESPGYFRNRVCGVSFEAIDKARAAIAKARGLE